MNETLCKLFHVHPLLKFIIDGIDRCDELLLDATRTDDEKRAAMRYKRMLLKWRTNFYKNSKARLYI